MSRRAEIANNVRKLRGTRSQTQVAEDMRARGWGWTQSTVTALENGDRALKLEEAADLAAVLGAEDVDALLADPRRDAVRDAYRDVETFHRKLRDDAFDVRACQLDLARAADLLAEEGLPLPIDPSRLIASLTWSPEEHLSSAIAKWNEYPVGESSSRGVELNELIAKLSSHQWPPNDIHPRDQESEGISAAALGKLEEWGLTSDEDLGASPRENNSDG